MICEDVLSRLIVEGYSCLSENVHDSSPSTASNECKLIRTLNESLGLGMVIVTSLRTDWPWTIEVDDIST